MRLRLAAVALAAVFALTALAAVLSAGAGAEEFSQQTRVHAPWTDQSVDLGGLFDAVVDTVNKHFFDEAGLKEHDWAERARAARPLVLASASVEDAVAQINGLLAGLGASHTSLYTPNDYEYYILSDIFGVPHDLMMARFWGSDPYYAGIGAFTRKLGGKNFVDAVLEGSPADKSGLKFGDEILSINGRPYSPIAAFGEKIGTTAELTIRRAADAQPQRLMSMVTPIRPTRAFFDATEASARIIERNGSRIGYVHVWALVEAASFHSALAKFNSPGFVTARLSDQPESRDVTLATAKEPPKPVDFLIVDLRGRVGGNVGVANELLRTLDDGSSYWGDWHTFGRSGGQTATGRQKASFRGRSALLIDAHTRSAGEIMAYGYKRSAFGPVFGSTTAGAVLSGAVYLMPGDTLLYLAVAGHEVDGHRLEGAGVTPDYHVEQPLPYAQGADPVLEAAANVLSSAVK